MIIQKTVVITLGVRNIHYYKSLGYEIPTYFNKQKNQFFVKRGTQIEIKVSDLLPQSHTKVLCMCDECNSTNSVRLSTIKANSNYICPKCINQNEERRKKISEANTGLTRSKEFKRNLSQRNSGENNGNFGKRGSNSPNWIPSLTDEERKRNIFGIQSWVKKVKERDDYTCQCCGFKGQPRDGLMFAHHINSFKNFKELRTDVNNGITLCQDCHCSNKGIGIHNLYGRITTKEHLKEYLEQSLTQLI
jgi:hypothetical protein